MAKLKKVNTEISINANREKIWDILFNQFSDIDIFHPGTTNSKLTKGKNGEIGCQRICEFGSKISVTENVVEAVPLERIAIDATGLPGVKDILAIFSLTQLGEESTEVKITFNFRTVPAILATVMAGSMRKKLHQVLVGLKYYTETGKPLDKNNFKGIYSEFIELAEGKAFA